MAGKDISDIPYLFVGAVVAVQEEIQKGGERLVQKGQSLTPEGRKKAATVKKGLVSKGDEFSTVVARTVQRALENTGLATRSDFEELDKKISAIEKRVLTRKKVVVKPAGKKPAAKKPKAKKPAAKKATAKKSA